MSGKFFRLSQRIDSNIIIRAIRHALIITVPILMIGSFALLLKSLPIWSYQNFIVNFGGGIFFDLFSLIYNACFSFFSLYLVINISFCYLMEYTSSIEDYITIPTVAMAGFLIIVNIGTDRFDISDLSVNGTFIALITSVTISILSKKFQNIAKGWIKIRTAGGILYQKAIRAILPSTIILLGCVLVNLSFRLISGVDGFSDLLTMLTGKLFKLINNNFLKGFVYMIIVQTLWLFGLHGGNIMESVVQQNFVDIVPDNIFNKTFYDVFVNMGGCGATICIVIAIFISSKRMASRNVAKGALLPVAFNINELITFGFPIVFNPIMAIPFILVPVMAYFVSYFATEIGLVPHIIKNVEWTTPVFLSGYVATGSIAGSILQLFCIVAGVLMYIPFIKLHETLVEQKLKSRVDMLTEILKTAEEYSTPPNLIGRNDIYGSTAKAMINELEQAIRTKELYMVYQPQIDNNGKCIGAEALIRWNNKNIGFIYPPLIIELAKEGKLLGELEMMIFDDVCKMAKEAEKYVQNVKISVNITAKSLNRHSLIDEIEKAADKYGVNPHCIWLEITENDVLSNAEEVTKKLRKLKECGHNLLIDDFSMGHTSLKYLKTQCFDGIKLDASITKNIKNDHISQEIIASLADLGKRLDIGIIAEYVEDESQKEVLKSLGCGLYQGYLYSKPIEAEDFLHYINEHKG